MNRKVKKGFTLVELIVVMAIFSILMVGVMAITKPVSAIFRNTSISEKTYSQTVMAMLTMLILQLGLKGIAHHITSLQ